MKKQHYMTEQERHQLEAMRRNKIPVREIARQLSFCERTIYYELKRGSYIHTCKYWDETRYSAQKGQQIHRYNQTAKGRPLKIGSDHTFAAYIEHTPKHHIFQFTADCAGNLTAGDAGRVQHHTIDLAIHGNELVQAGFQGRGVYLELAVLNNR